MNVDVYRGILEWQETVDSTQIKFSTQYVDN